MDTEVRQAIERLEIRVMQLAASLQTLQALAQYHDEEIKALAAPMRDPARVRPSP